MLQSSAKVEAGGDAISRATFHPTGWYQISVPTTVVAAQVAAGQFPDPYFGMNLRRLPGMAYEIGDLFPLRPMPKDSPYAVPWWFRKEFELPSSFANKTSWLHFDGINYRANIWVNGKKVADSNDVAGAYRTYEFNVTSLLRPGKNVVAVEVFAPTEKDLGMNFWDWNPTPPDKDMGLWSDVYVTASGPVAVRYPEVVTRLVSGGAAADLTVIAELENASDRQIEGVVDATLQASGVHVKQTITLAPGEKRTVTFTPEQNPALHVQNPKLWWPAQMGTPTLQHLALQFLVGGKLSDEQRIRFGIREITSELTDKGYRVFRINGKPLLIRGGGWTPDMLLHKNRKNLEGQFSYVRDLNLNTVRLEGKMESDDFFDLADEQGVLVMAGWMCCDIWQKWDEWPPGNLPIALESQRSQLLRLRSHPSQLVWLSSSDEPPPPEIERAFQKVVEETAWPNPSLSTASDRTTPVNGHSGVKMSGPYDWVPPSYWDAEQYGGAFGFNTETSAGAAIPPVSSLRKFIPAEHLWPPDGVWNFHAGGENFTNIDKFNRALNAVYGTATGLDDYERKAQAMNYENERAMFEAYSGRKYTSTGVIQWLLNNAWPSIIWHLYDYYLQPAGGYFGAKKANEPVHVQYSYMDRGVYVVNSTYRPMNALHVSTHVYGFDLSEKFTHDAQIDVASDGVQRVVTIPTIATTPDAQIYFVKLELTDSAGKTLSSNFYWVSSKQAVLDWPKTNDFVTPTLVDEDMTALNRLPTVALEAHVTTDPHSGAVQVRLHNPAKSLAFQVHAGICPAGSTDEILPVLWSDNYVSVMPGESKALSATYPQHNLHGSAVARIEGWNVKPLVVTVPSSAATREAKR